MKKLTLILLILYVSLWAKDLTPFNIGNIPTFDVDEFNRIDALWNRAEMLWDRYYSGDLTTEEKAFTDTCFIFNGDHTRPKSPYWIDNAPRCGDPINSARVIYATTTYPSSSQHTYDAINVNDNDLSTAWVEGKDDYGIGERLVFRYKIDGAKNTPELLKGSSNCWINIYNGYVKSESSWSNNSRVKKFILGTADSIIATLHLEDTRASQQFLLDLPNTLNDAELYLEIAEVYPGNRWSDVAITEVEIKGGSCCFALGTKITKADFSTTAVETITKGDSILTRNSEGNLIGAEVLNTIEIIHNNCYTVKFSNSNLTLTNDHPMLLTTGKWATILGGYSQYVNGVTIRLQVGDKVVLQDGETIVEAITPVKTAIKTYTITKLSEGSLFFANGITVAVDNDQ